MPSFHDVNQHSGDRRPPLYPYAGWALDVAIELDHACPGLLATTFGYGHLRRQALYLILAACCSHGMDEIAHRLRGLEPDVFGREPEPAAAIGQAILIARHPRELIGAVIGCVPAGLLGTLHRLGPDPADAPGVYAELTRLFVSTDPLDRRRVKILGQVSGVLVHNQIMIIGMLAPVLLHPALLAVLREVRHVAEIHCAMAYVRARCSGATDAAIRTSLGLIKPDGHRSALIRWWAARFDRLPHAFDAEGDPTLHVLASADAMAKAGKRYANCLQDRIEDAFLGVYVFVEWRPVASDASGLIAELRRTSLGYLLEGLYAPGNRQVRPDVARIARRALAARGVALLSHAQGDQRVFETTAELLGAHDLVGADSDVGWGYGPHEAAIDLEQLPRRAA